MSLYEETGAENEALFDLVEGFVEWNVDYANFGYYIGSQELNTASDATAMTFCDPQAWYVMQTGAAPPPGGPFRCGWKVVLRLIAGLHPITLSAAI